MIVLVDKLNAIAQTRGLNSGIDPRRKNHPDQQWILLAISTLEPNEEIFNRTYVPPTIRRDGAQV